MIFEVIADSLTHASAKNMKKLCMIFSKVLHDRLYSSAQHVSESPKPDGLHLDLGGFTSI